MLTLYHCESLQLLYLLQNNKDAKDQGHACEVFSSVDSTSINGNVCYVLLYFLDLIARTQRSTASSLLFYVQIMQFFFVCVCVECLASQFWS